MSSTRRATPPTSNNQLFIEALADYTNITGTDLSNDTTLKQARSPKAILQLLQEREKNFQDYRDDNPRLISYVTPVVNVLWTFSGILGNEVQQVPILPANALFVGIDLLLDAASEITPSYDAVLDLFECFGSFFQYLEIYKTTHFGSTDIVFKIVVELLSVLALATKQIKQGQFKRFAKKLLRESEIDAVLQRLDRRTDDEVRSTPELTLCVVYGLMCNVRVAMEDGKASTHSFRQDMVALQQMSNKTNKRNRDELQKNVRQWMSPPDPSINQDFFWRARHAGSAAWFFESKALTEWRARASLLWIHGKLGAGKSSLL